MSANCCRVATPTLLVCGVLLPLPIPTASRNKKEAGGVLIMNVKLRSLYTVITTGKGVPLRICAVYALKALQNSIMFTPRGPNAGPTGGFGAASPAFTCNLIYA